MYASRPCVNDGCLVLALAAFTALGLQVESREAKRIHARVYCFEQQRKEHDDHRSLNPALHRAARVHRSVGNAVVVRASHLQFNHNQQLLRAPQHAPHVRTKGNKHGHQGDRDDGFQIRCLLQEVRGVSGGQTSAAMKGWRGFAHSLVFVAQVIGVGGGLKDDVGGDVVA